MGEGIKESVVDILCGSVLPFRVGELSDSSLVWQGSSLNIHSTLSRCLLGPSGSDFRCDYKLKPM